MDWQSRRVNLMMLPEAVKSQLIARYTDKEVSELTDEERADIIRNHLEGICAEGALKIWLEYEGIIGYTDKLINVFTAIQDASQ